MASPAWRQNQPRAHDQIHMAGSPDPVGSKGTLGYGRVPAPALAYVHGLEVRAGAGPGPAWTWHDGDRYHARQLAIRRDGPALHSRARAPWPPEPRVPRRRATFHIRRAGTCPPAATIVGDRAASPRDHAIGRPGRSRETGARRRTRRRPTRWGNVVWRVGRGLVAIESLLEVQAPVASLGRPCAALARATGRRPAPTTWMHRETILPDWRRPAI